MPCHLGRHRRVFHRPSALLHLFGWAIGRRALDHGWMHMTPFASQDRLVLFPSCLLLLVVASPLVTSSAVAPPPPLIVRILFDCCIVVVQCWCRPCWVTPPIICRHHCRSPLGYPSWVLCSLLLHLLHLSSGQGENGYGVMARSLLQTIRYKKCVHTREW